MIMRKIKLFIGCTDSMEDALLGDGIKTEEKTFSDDKGMRLRN